MSRPIIGITSSLSCDRDGGSSQVLDCRYVDAVERAGGCPLILPMCTAADSLRPLLELIHGLIITGGPGITEGLMGELPADLPPVEAQREQSDSWAFEVLQECNKPILGICYGMQFINARSGGAIYADVEEQLKVGAHSPRRNGGRGIQHGIELVRNTFLGELLGEVPPGAEVNSFHIQAVAQVGAGLRVNARSADGLIEGVENEDGGIVGVQFHPERMPGTIWERLFEHLVERAAQWE
tara:strand:- start:326 stop:1042 length:717 start_codon:yes stop_codon:yes gene_type:complete